MRRWIAIAVVAPWAAWAIGRTLGLDRAHPLIAAVAFTPWVALTSPIAILVALALRRRLVALVALVVVVLLGVAVVPRGLGADDPARGPGAITVMTHNLHGGRADPERVVDLVRRRHVDVLLLEEMTAESVVRLDRAGLRSVFPQRALEPRPGGIGNGIFSRHPMRRVPEWELSNEPAADLTVPGFTAPVRVRVVHPYPPINRAQVREWRAHLRAMPAAPDHAAIMAGDFNATLDHRDLRRVLARGWQDAAAETGEGWRPTWPVGRRILGLAIDHVLVSRDLAIGPVSIHEIPGSDHRAVVARIALPGSS